MKMYSNFGENALANYVNKEIIGRSVVIQGRARTGTCTGAWTARRGKWWR